MGLKEWKQGWTVTVRTVRLMRDEVWREMLLGKIGWIDLMVMNEGGNDH